MEADGWTRLHPLGSSVSLELYSCPPVSGRTAPSLLDRVVSGSMVFSDRPGSRLEDSG